MSANDFSGLEKVIRVMMSGSPSKPLVFDSKFHKYIRVRLDVFFCSVVLSMYKMGQVNPGQIFQFHINLSNWIGKLFHVHMRQSNVNFIVREDKMDTWSVVNPYLKTQKRKKERRYYRYEKSNPDTKEKIQLLSS